MSNLDSNGIHMYRKSVSILDKISAHALYVTYLEGKIAVPRYQEKI